MESRKEIAASKKLSGRYNCTQAVCCTYHDLTGLDEDTKKRVIDYILTNCEGRMLIFVSHCPDDAALLNAKEIRI